MKNIYFITCTIIDWISIFTRKKYFDLIIKDFQYKINNFDFILYDFVIMDNHIHFICSSKNVKKVVKSIKMYTALLILNQLKEDQKSRLLNQLNYHKKSTRSKSQFQVWKDESMISQIESYDEYKLKKMYIHKNPYKAGLSRNLESYEYISNNPKFDYLVSRIRSSYFD